ncbi:MAG: YlxR family protein [Aggregatilineales bacterium]
MKMMPKKQTQQHLKRVPIRMCVVCREKDEKRQLMRLVRTPDGIQVDTGGKMNGRGAYICEKIDCWERILRTDILSRALKMKLTNQDRERLQRAMP